MTASLSGVLSAERSHLRQLSDDATGERADGNPPMKVLDLFSGIGGFSLGLERTGGFETVAFCEIEPYCRAVLAKHWPGVPCYDDVRTLSADRLVRDGIAIDVICGGFPCQDISVAGAGAGIDGERSGLWREYARLVGEIRPRYVLVENVAALLGRGLDRVLGDLAALGYDAEWHCIPASAIGANHRRDRVWIMAHTDGVGGGYKPARPDTFRLLGGILSAPLWERPSEPAILGMDDGLPSRVDRLRSLGNAVVPQIPEIIGRTILKAEATQIIGNASPLGISPDDGPEVATLAPPGFVSTLFCSQDHGASSSFLLSSHDVHPEGDP